MVSENPNLTEAYFISSFLSGLNEELRPLVNVLRPKTLSQAIEQARLQELALEAMYRKQRLWAKGGMGNSGGIKNWNAENGNKSSFTGNGGRVIGSGNFKNIGNFSNNRSLQNLTKSSVASNVGEARRQPGQCFKCGDKYFVGHVCKKQLMNMEVEGEIARMEEEDQNQGEEVGEEEPDSAELSIHAMNGQFSHSTMKFKGSVGNRSLLILIDRGSTHSFLDEEVARELRCKTRATTPLAVTIANGQKMLSSAKTEGFSWKL